MKTESPSQISNVKSVIDPEAQTRREIPPTYDGREGGVSDPALGTAVSPGIVFGTIETCFCLRCESAIPSTHISKSLMPGRRDQIEPTRQMVRAFCPHCNLLYQLTRELRDGQWGSELGSVAIITNKREVASFQKRINFLIGDRQVNDSPHRRRPA